MVSYERLPDAREYTEAPQQRNRRAVLRTVRKQQCGKSRRPLALSKLLCRGRFLLFGVRRGRSLGVRRDETRLAARHLCLSQEVHARDHATHRLKLSHVGPEGGFLSNPTPRSTKPVASTTAPT
jgi:hypothetical protein